jgi:hypothetical protein
VDVKRVLHIVRSPEAVAIPAVPAAVAEHDVLVYTYVPAQPPGRAWLLWRDPAHAGAPDPLHVQAIDTAALCRLAFELDAVVVW